MILNPNKMVIITIKETTKQAKAVIEMLKTFDFVQFENKEVGKPKENTF